MKSEAYSRVEKAAWLAGISVAKLCREAQVKPTTVYRWKSGHHSALERTLNKLLTKAAEMQKHNRHLPADLDREPFSG